MLRHQKYIELPAKLNEMRMGANVASLMGILPEINESVGDSRRSSISMELRISPV